ncbi:MAG: hypothetical protein A2075_24065 [Geobacteraceae bacterium GWC2_58_44]|nr:MAG: hypothetical protein A2075_24065 [Geobacteraceae bacterium GWC2_58_44]
MLIVCPNCKKRFDVDPATAQDSRKLRCSSCRAVFRLVRKAQGEPAVPPPPAPAASARLKVVLANESVSFCEAVRKVLSSEPFELFICNDGKMALETVQRVTPELLLLDVALPTMFGFEVCERVRQDPALSGVRIVLIASIYDKTRYKRSPNSLYGADDYIEKHHIPDSLIPMIYRLASGKVPGATSPSASELAAQQESRSEIREFEVRETCSGGAPLPDTRAPVAADPGRPAPCGAAPGDPRVGAAPVELPEVELKARRLARIIVSDIVLYNQGKVEQGLREGTFYALLADDIREGELLYRQRVSQEVRDNSSFLKDAFEDLIAKKRAELRI